MMITTEAFGAYDVRGVYPETINEEIAYRVGRAFPGLFDAHRVAVGHDIRLSGPSLQAALVRGLTEAGCDVLDIGMCGTEMIYFATGYYELDGGIMITASHNPAEYNGLKFVRQGARPISSDDGLLELKRAVEEFGGDDGVTTLSACNKLHERPLSAKALSVCLSLALGTSPRGGGKENGGDDPLRLDALGTSPIGGGKGHVEQRDIMADYVAHMLSYIDVAQLRERAAAGRRLKVVANVGNGAAGAAVAALARELPFDMVLVNEEPDGHFPNGVPNPLLPENREATARVVRETGADVGVAWDGDFDRCFIFDEQGTCIDGYYLVGFLAAAFLQTHPGAGIIYDPRLTWNTIELVEQYGGRPIMSRSGHAFIKAKMRETGALYGGEMSSHHYFRDFYCCDSGMLPWLLVMSLLAQSDQPLSALLAERMARYPISGEINSRVADPAAVLARVEQRYADGKVTHVDGLSVEYDTWRFNLRRSNTEPLLRLNVETRGDRALCAARTQELLALIRG